MVVRAVEMMQVIKTFCQTLVSGEVHERFSETTASLIW